ncbi:MAG TPA: GAF domain-containing protein [Anaeromyxobacteraceae bacterium]|nr:GAF domain-containing protein [Anaeromyxobacteraceae bacterium]
MARASWALAQCSRALVRAASEEELLGQLCRILVQVGEYHMAWVGYCCDDAKRSIRPVAQAGFSEGYVEGIHVTWADEPSGRGPMGTAIRTGRPTVIRCARTDPSFAPWREQAAERGFASVIGLPLVLGGRAIGALTVYAVREDAFDAEEQELLQRLTDDVAFGIGALRDRAERERAEAAVAASEEMFRSAFEYASTGKALTDPEGRYVRVNAAFARMLGYAPDALLRMRFADVTHPADRAASEDAHRRLLAGQLPTITLEKRYLARDGSEVVADVSVSIVRAADGSPRYCITDVQDVTTRRRAEEQFHRAQRMEALGVLAGGIAHDLNNLLTVILSASGFALAAAPPGQLREDIEEVRGAADRARAVTRQLLAFGRRQVLEPGRVDLAAMVRDTERSLKRIVGERVALRVGAPSAPAPILADPAQIEQLLVTLAMNARDAMPRGGTLSVEVLEAGDPPAVRLVVADTGSGMDARTRARAFEPFFTTKPIGQGAGLGLSTAAAIVERAGGAIDLDSAPGKGTRFVIRFPRLAEDAPPAPIHAAPAAGGGVVVVVDDDEHVRRSAARMLRAAGLDVLTGGTLDEVLEGVARHSRPPAVLLTDVRMPTCSGPELAAALGARVPGLRTVYMSGYATGDLADEGTFPPGTPFVQKPFTAGELVEKVREAMREAG